mgnify:CR=1 FL=1
MKSLTTRKRLLSTLGLLLAGPALASQTPPMIDFFDTGVTQCWERTYDTAHLKEHPRQLVTAISFTYFPTVPFMTDEQGELLPYWFNDGQYSAFNPMVRVRFRDSGHEFENMAICTSAPAEDLKPGQIHCGIECDGGSFTIEVEPDGNLILRNRGFAVTPCGEPAPGEEDVRLVRPEDDQKVFRLYPMEADACRLPEMPEEG